MDLAIGEGDGPLSLYFRLKSGEKADLEVAAHAAIAWASTLRAAALAIDPESELRIEIVDANESSLIVNAILRWVRNNLDPAVVRMERGAKKMPKTFRLALAVAPSLSSLLVLPTKRILTRRILRQKIMQSSKIF